MGAVTFVTAAVEDKVIEGSREVGFSPLWGV
jgi:hypothetical protein